VGLAVGAFLLSASRDVPVRCQLEVGKPWRQGREVEVVESVVLDLAVWIAGLGGEVGRAPTGRDDVLALEDKVDVVPIVRADATALLFVGLRGFGLGGLGLGALGRLHGCWSVFDCAGLGRVGLLDEQWKNLRPVKRVLVLVLVNDFFMLQVATPMQLAFSCYLQCCKKYVCEEAKCDGKARHKEWGMPGPGLVQCLYQRLNDLSDLLSSFVDKSNL